MLRLKKKFGLLLVFLLGQLFLSIFVGTSVTYGAGHTKAPEGLHVWGKDLSGMTEKEAFGILKNEIPSTVVYDEKILPLELTQTYLELENWVANQYTPRTGQWLTDAFEYVKRITQTPESPQTLNKDEIIPQLEAFSRMTDRQGKPAHLTYEDGELVLEKGSDGATLNVEASWEALRQSRGNQPVPLIIDKNEVHPTTAEFQRVKDKLGDYTTYFNPLLKERVNNVQLAAKAIDGSVIPPGGEFSFNETVGKREKARGYLPALMFVDNKVVADDGGGICQDSSTLYQVIRQSKLQILERNSHSLPVAYVPVGQDATVAYGLLDFRFRNDTQGYLLISARTGSNWIRIRLFGEADDKHPKLSAPDGYPIKPEDWVKDPK